MIDPCNRLVEYPVLDTVGCAWRDIGYYCVAEVHEHWMDVKVYEFYLYRHFGEQEWDGESPVAIGQAPPGYAFDRDDSSCKPNPVKATAEAQVFLSGSIKWDGCSNLQFDEQDNVCLHFCGKKAAMNVGVLLGRLYELAEKHMPAFDSSIAE